MSSSKISSLVLAENSRLIQRNGIEGFNYYLFILNSEHSTRESAVRVTVGNYTTKTFTQEPKNLRAEVIEDIPYEGYTLKLASGKGSLQAEFDSLVRQWRKETFLHSSLSKVFTNSAYQTIMAMGKEGIPLVLRELQKGQGDWFYALKHMAREDVAAGIKNFKDAQAAWLEWGYKNNYL